MPIKFDPTINAGNLLQGGVLLVTIAIAFAVHDRRISVLEDRDMQDRTVQVELRTEQKEALREIKSDIKDLQKSVNEVSRAVAAKPTVRIP